MAGPPANLNPDALRRIDYWLGRPICFGLTLIRRVSALFTPPSADVASPRNVLFIELAEMGSTVLACPAVHHLRVAYPGCRVFFLVFRHIDESVKVLNLIPDEDVLTIDVSSPARLVRDTFRFMREARRLEIDTAITLEMFARFSAILCFLSGARWRVGFHGFTQRGLYLGDLFTHNVMYSPHLHTWQSFLALVRALEMPASERPVGKRPAGRPDEAIVPHVPSNPAARSRVTNLLSQFPALRDKRLVVINPNASKLISIRKWPLDRYAALVTRLLEDPDVACVITGVASEAEDAAFIEGEVKSDRVVSLAGRTSLRDLIELYMMAELLVTNDSGPAHFAALTDIHVVVFFGPETPALYRPLTNRCTVMYADYACSPCVSAYNQRLSPCTNNRCLKAIDVDVVYETIREILSARRD